MNRIIKLLFLLPSLNVCLAQNQVVRDTLPNYFNEGVGKGKNIVAFRVDGLYASTFFDKDVFFKQYLSTNIIDNQLTRLNNKNRVGIDAQAAIVLNLEKVKLFGRRDLSPWIMAKHQAITGASLNEAIVKLVLKGNAENHVISFDDSKVLASAQQFSQLSFGFNKIGNNSKFSMGLGLIVGNNYFDTKIKGGTITTNDNGEYIDGENLDFIVSYSDANYPQDLGLTSCFKFVKETKTKNLLTFELEDFGLIRWKSITSYKPKSQTFNYEGFNLTGFWEKGYEVNLEDSLNGNYVVKTNESVLKLSPFLFKVKYRLNLQNASFIDTDLGYRHIPGYLPALRVVYGKYLKSSNRLFAGFNFGGFGVAAINVGTDLKINSNVGFKFDFTGYESLISASIPTNWRLLTGLYFNL